MRSPNQAEIKDECRKAIPVRDPLLPKFQREKLVYDLLQGSEIPVPEKVWLDGSKELVRFDVLISERLSGALIEPDWGTLPVDKRSQLAVMAGALLSRLHRSLKIFHVMRRVWCTIASRFLRWWFCCDFRGYQVSGPDPQDVVFARLSQRWLCFFDKPEESGPPQMLKDRE